ncbi:type VI secretion system tip protein VgrG, partial [Neisseriaceae bacterium TC5R-5]|nr:type VI secretion system tip protein VgrG [Neisseriaceae bacterium TC5R-5]
SLKGSETLNQLFEYELVLRTPNSHSPHYYAAANLALNTLVGQELTVFIELAGDNPLVCPQREITTLIKKAQLLRQEGRILYYQLTLTSNLYVATLNKENRVFQNLTPIELIETILQPYPVLLEKRLIEKYPQREIKVQLGESDYDFFSRICEEFGLSWYNEHHDQQQYLVLTDNMGAYRRYPHSEYETLHYDPENRRDSEHLHQVIASDQLTTGRFTSKDYDYSRSRADLTVSREQARPTAHNLQEHYDYRTDSHYSQPLAGTESEHNQVMQEGEWLARLAMERLSGEGERLSGDGRHRAIAVGYVYQLADYPQDRLNRAYLILHSELDIKEVAEDSQQAGQTQHPGFSVQSHFIGQPTVLAYRPPLLTRKPTSGPLLATVTGPEGESLWCDEFGRIKALLHFDRVNEPNQNSLCWLRVSSTWAGNQLGQISLPRVGSEVVVSFIDNNPDLPYVSGALHNDGKMPPLKLTHNQAISGLRSRELGADGAGNSANGRSNTLLFDDSENHIQLQASSEHLSSSLHLGNIRRIDGNEGLADERGEGAELRTDGAAAIRAAKGLLLTTDGRSNAVGGSLSRDELTLLVQHALELVQSLNHITDQQEGSARDTEPQQQLKQAVQHLGHGLGPEAKLSPPGGQPIIAMSAPAGIVSATPKSQSHYAGQNFDLISGQHQQYYAKGSIHYTAQKNIESHAIEGNWRGIASKGRVELQAQNNAMDIFSKLGLTIRSADGWIDIVAKKGIRIHGNTSTLVIGGEEDSIIGKTPGVNTFYAAAHDTQPPLAVPQTHPTFNEPVCIQCLLNAAKQGSGLSL